MRQKNLANTFFSYKQIITMVLTGLFLVSGCAPYEPTIAPPSDQNTANAEIEQIVLYENERIRDAEKTEVVSLEKLGYDNLTLSVGNEVSTPVIEYILPDNATQGPDTWYIFNLHFLIEFEDDTGEGFCTVSAKGTGASVNVETNIVDGATPIDIGNRSLNSTRLEVRYYNYMMIRSIKPGRNEMYFTFDQQQGARVRNIIIYKDSGIVTTGTAPSDYEEGLKVTEDSQARAEDLVFKHPWVQEVVEGKKYTLRIIKAESMVRPANELPDNDIEVRLVFEKTYTIEGVEASALVVFVNLDDAVVTDIYPLDTNRMPALMESTKERAVAIALSDPIVREELEGKKYTVGHVGVSTGGPVGRLGANVLFVFNEPFSLDPVIPSAPARQQTGVKAFVNLKEAKVVQVTAESRRITPPED